MVVVYDVMDGTKVPFPHPSTTPLLLYLECRHQSTLCPLDAATLRYPILVDRFFPFVLNTPADMPVKQDC